MPESTIHAKILIDISFQGYNRARLSGTKHTKLCDCTVMLVFAGFFIEANLNHIIIDVMGKEQEMSDFWNRKNLGIQDKLAWFYNFYGTDPSIKLTKDQVKKRELKEELYKNLRAKFPGFDEIYKFRNNISHGKIDLATANINDAERLRKHAKKIVDELVNLAENAGYRIRRTTRSDDAVG